MSRTRSQTAQSGWNLRRLLDALHQVCEAVGCAHSRGLVASHGAGQGPTSPWNNLLWRTFDGLGAACPVCGRVMALRAVVRGPETGRVLAGLERAARGPPVRAVEEAGT